MIINKKEKTEMIFGTGDICVIAGYEGHDELDIKVPVVAFKNQTSRQIGKDNGDIKGGIYEDLKVDVIMRFSEKESIDMVIDALQEAKNNF